MRLGVKGGGGGLGSEDFNQKTSSFGVVGCRVLLQPTRLERARWPNRARGLLNRAREIDASSPTSD